MSVMVLLDFDVKEGKLEEFLSVLEQTLPDTRAYLVLIFINTSF